MKLVLPVQTQEVDEAWPVICPPCGVLPGEFGQSQVCLQGSESQRALQAMLDITAVLVSQAAPDRPGDPRLDVRQVGAGKWSLMGDKASQGRFFARGRVL